MKTGTICINAVEDSQILSNLNDRFDGNSVSVLVEYAKRLMLMSQYMSDVASAIIDQYPDRIYEIKLVPNNNMFEVIAPDDVIDSLIAQGLIERNESLDLIDGFDDDDDDDDSDDEDDDLNQPI